MSESDAAAVRKEDLESLLLDITLLLVHIATMAKLAGLGRVDEMKELSSEVEGELEALIKTVSMYRSAGEVPHE